MAIEKKQLIKFIGLVACAAVLTIGTKHLIYKVGFTDAKKVLQDAAPHMPKHSELYTNFFKDYPVSSALKLAILGDPNAEYLIGWMYESGAGGTDKDVWNRWIDMYWQLLTNSDASIAHPPSMNYDSIDQTIQRKEQNDVAFYWFKQAADHGSTAALAEIGYMYEIGKLGKYNDEESRYDEESAVSWYERAAEKGDPQGQIDLGKMYEEGKGVKKDFARAMSLYETASKNKSDIWTQWDAKIKAESLWARKGVLPSAEFRRGEKDAIEFVSRYGSYWELSRLASESSTGGLPLNPERTLALYKLAVSRCPKTYSNWGEELAAGGTIAELKSFEYQMQEQKKLKQQQMPASKVKGKSD